MPWIETENCSGCGVCVSKCPVGTIYLQEGVAFIDMTNCIHCGVCHSACPKGAVRHDSEKILEEVRVNVDMTKGFMEECAKYLGEEKEKKKCLNRMIKHFNKEKTVVEKTLQELQLLMNQI